MKNYLETVTTHITEHKQQFTVGAVATVCVIVFGALFIYNQPHPPKLAYEPTKACDMLTPNKAMDVLGNEVISTDANTPVIASDAETATSRCSYTDKNADGSAMQSLAISVRSATNPTGIAQNKSEFTGHKKNVVHTEDVKDLGNEAYFDEDLGLLHILTDKQWIMLSYKTGQTLESKPVSDVVSLAHKVLK
jgi:hypothetical protein